MGIYFTDTFSRCAITFIDGNNFLISQNIGYEEHGGLEVVCQTLNLEVQGLYPWSWAVSFSRTHFNFP